MTTRPKMGITEGARQARQIQAHEEAGTYLGKGWFFYGNVSMVCGRLADNKARCEKRYPTATVKIVEKAFDSKYIEIKGYASIWFKFEEEDTNNEEETSGEENAQGREG